MTVDMNNPTCGDRIRLTFDIEDGIINDAKFEGEGCSISMSSASMMTEAVKGHSLGEAMQMSQEFTKMMLGKTTRLQKKWEILRRFKVSHNSQLELNVQRLHGKH